jgi:hypothetical protein
LRITAPTQDEPGRDTGRSVKGVAALNRGAIAHWEKFRRRAACCFMIEQLFVTVSGDGSHLCSCGERETRRAETVGGSA